MVWVQNVEGSIPFAMNFKWFISENNKSLMVVTTFSKNYWVFLFFSLKRTSHWTKCTTYCAFLSIFKNIFLFKDCFAWFLKWIWPSCLLKSSLESCISWSILLNSPKNGRLAWKDIHLGNIFGNTSWLFGEIMWKSWINRWISV